MHSGKKAGQKFKFKKPMQQLMQQRENHSKKLEDEPIHSKLRSTISHPIILITQLSWRPHHTFHQIVMFVSYCGWKPSLKKLLHTKVLCCQTNTFMCNTNIRSAQSQFIQSASVNIPLYMLKDERCAYKVPKVVRYDAQVDRDSLIRHGSYLAPRLASYLPPCLA